MNKPKRIKHSYGISLIRFNHNKKRYEVCMIKKRYTYSYFDLLHSPIKRNDEDRIKKLLNNTTFEEKIILLKLNFKLAYDHIWDGKIFDRNLYHKYEEQFNKEFIEPDNGVKFTNWIYNAKHIQLDWELPKGHKHSGSENPIDCAIRELYEETGLDRKFYRLIPNCYRREKITDNNITYLSTYYAAIPRTNIHLKLQLTNKHQISEIKELAWVPTKKIDDKNIYKIVIRNQINYIKKYSINI